MLLSICIKHLCQVCFRAERHGGHERGAESGAGCGAGAGAPGASFCTSSPSNTEHKVGCSPIEALPSFVHCTEVLSYKRGLRWEKNSDKRLIFILYWMFCNLDWNDQTCLWHNMSFHQTTYCVIILYCENKYNCADFFPLIFYLMSKQYWDFFC